VLKRAPGNLSVLDKTLAYEPEPPCSVCSYLRYFGLVVPRRSTGVNSVRERVVLALGEFRPGENGPRDRPFNRMAQF
jgi:hypothetical protein